MIEDDLDVIRFRRATGINVLKTDKCVSALDFDDHWVLTFENDEIYFYFVVIPSNFAKFCEAEKMKLSEMWSNCEKEEIAV